MKSIALIHTVKSVASGFDDSLRNYLGYEVKIHNLWDDFLANNPIRATDRLERNAPSIMEPVPAFTTRYTSQHTPPVSPDQPRYFLGISNTSPKLSTAINEPAT